MRFWIMRFSLYAEVVSGKIDSRYMHFPLNILHLCDSFKNINKSYLKTFSIKQKTLFMSWRTKWFGPYKCSSCNDLRAIFHRKTFNEKKIISDGIGNSNDRILFIKGLDFFSRLNDLVLDFTGIMTLETGSKLE